jgi:hypothetical protein
MTTTTETEDCFEAMVIDRAAEPDWPAELGNFHRFTVPMELEITAASKAEALELAMHWRDVIGMSAHSHHPDVPASIPVICEALNNLDFDWHLHHPWGC